jgi:putative DNA primase/helicase
MTGARSLTVTLGGRWCGSYGVARCPAHADREPSLKIRDDATKLDGIDVHCFAGCTWQNVKIELQRQGLLETELPRCPRTAEATPPGTILSPKTDDDTKKRIGFALRIWRETVPLKDTPGLRYFTERRGLHIGTFDLDHALRWHQHEHMIVGLMTDPSSNVPTGIHRTFLAKDATKISRKMLGRVGVIRLIPDDEVTLGLGIAEGIEDALAVMLSGWRPVWAATSAGGIDRFPVLTGIESLTVFADSDATGLKAARVCVERWISAGREARISHPKELADVA